MSETLRGEFDCVFCGYEPDDPDGIYSEIFDAYICWDCEQIAYRILVSAVEAGRFRIGALNFQVRGIDG